MDDDFWEAAARQDPLWAILSDPSKSNRRWVTDEFFETGRREISLLLHQLRGLNRSPKFGSALDFGCGVGRLTQALGRYFSSVLGIDTSPTMIDLAQRLNLYPSTVTYLLNNAPSLSVVAPHAFDLVYSDVVLQHIPPLLTREYIAEFFRVSRPGAIVVFQLTSDRRDPDDRLQLSTMSGVAYLANIVLLERVSAVLEPGRPADVSIRVRNASPEPWIQRRSGPIRVGNHWLDPVGSMLVQDDGRVPLTADLEPGGSCDLILRVQAPQTPGHYICEIDLVHEGITWFADRGSPSLRLPFSVGTAWESSDSTEGEPIQYADVYAHLPPSAGEISGFPMHGVPQAEVLDIVGRFGSCFYIEDDERGGPEWRGYRYFCQVAR